MKRLKPIIEYVFYKELDYSGSFSYAEIERENVSK